MFDLRNLSRRRFLKLGGAAGSSLLLPPGLIRSASAAAPLPAVKEEDAVIGFGHVGPVTDEGWTWSHHQGMKAVKEAFPKLKTSSKSRTSPTRRTRRAPIRQFVSEGANMVFDDLELWRLPLRRRRSARPKSPSRMRRPQPDRQSRLATIVAHWYPTYVIGVAAGLLSKTGKLGYVASFPVPSVYSGTNAFLMGARTSTRTRPCRSSSSIPGSIRRPPRQAGTALIDNGCDFLFGIMDEAGYLQVAEKRGVKAAMWNTDIRRYGPKAYVSSIIIDFEAILCRAGAASASPAPGRRASTLLPMGAGIDRDTWGEKVPAEVAQAGRRRARKDPRRLVALRRRDQGRQGQREGRQRPDA